jgi:hypothetical protein
MTRTACGAGSSGAAVARLQCLDVVVLARVDCARDELVELRV